MNPDKLRTALCSHFCAEVHVGTVPAGLGFSMPVEDAIGDRIGAYLIEDQGAPYLADDGMFLADLEAQGIEPLKGQRREFLDRVLRPAGAFIDETSMEIRTHALEETPSPVAVIRFLSALTTARGVQFWTREAIRSTFIEDAAAAIRTRVGDRAIVEPNGVADRNLADFPADLLIRPTARGILTSVFLVQGIEKMNEALMLWFAAAKSMPGRLRVAALVEDTGTLPMTGPKAQRAINRIDVVTYFRDDEEAAVEKIARVAEVAMAA